jgi:geranylgeranyl reductase family protein
LNFDIIIVGAGPAGCSCALSLKDSGLNVALIDKAEFPREKICGGGIPGPALKHIESISSETYKRLTELQPKEINRHTSIISPNGKSLTVNWKNYAFSCKREYYDAVLLDSVRRETNTHVLLNEKIENINKKENEIEIVSSKNTYHSKLIIGCDGANSMVRKALIEKKIAANNAIAVRAFYKNVQLPKKETLYVYYLKEITPGYLWVFPTGDNTYNVGLGYYNINNKKQNINLREELIKAIENNKILKPLFLNAEQISDIKGHVLPSNHMKMIVSGDNFMLCGDAAGLVDPLFGHGIDKAILSGKLAAQQAVYCFIKKNFSNNEMKNYEKEIFHIRKQLLRFKYLRILFKHAWLINLVISLFNGKKSTRWLKNKFSR